MKRRLIFGLLGKFMIIEAVLLILPAMVSVIYGEYGEVFSFLISAAISAVIGIALYLQSPKNTEFYAKEGLVVIGLVWLSWSLVGALPFYISGEIPRYVDCFFETVSGFTTTGATILTDIEAMSHGMLFWRSFTHWIGGMGVLVFAMAIVSVSDKNAIHLMRAEVPGPSVSKLVPRGVRNAEILYGIYIVLCILEFIMLVAGGMPVYDSIIHTFSTAGTGGFSCKNASIGAYNSAYIEWVITAFMLLFSINFNMYYFLIARKFSAVGKNSEWKVFFIVVIAASACLTFAVKDMYANIAEALRAAVFQTASVISTTGFGTADFNLWGGFAKSVIIVLMIIGACAGSTGGGLKVSRVMIMAKSAVRSAREMLRPHSVSNVKLDGKVVEEETVRMVSGYIIVYIGIIGISLLLIGINNLTFEEVFSSVITCVNNVGPGFGTVGPVGNFAALSDLSKIVLSLDMLLGRLEIFPILLLFVPAMWRKKFI